MRQPKIALIHDYLTQYGGAEKTLEAVSEIFPEAPIYTGLYDKTHLTDYLNSKKIHCLKNPLLKAFPKYLSFLMPLVFESFDLREYDIVLSDSACWAKGVLTKPEQLHISFIHTPPRFLYKYSVESAKRNKWYFKPVIVFLDAILRIWDFSAAQRPNFLLANSREIQNRIKKFYKRESTLMYPPVDIEFKKTEATTKISGQYFIAVGRLVAYKHFDILIKAFNELGTKLVLVGRGIEEQNLKNIAGPNILFVGRVSEEEKNALVQGSLGLINAVDDEDFGIVPVEAMSKGVPVLGHKSGGHLETIKEGETGMFFEELSVDSLKTAIKKFKDSIEQGKFDPENIKNSVQKYSKDRFQREYKEFVESKWKEFQSKNA